jgi:hypothetical protein
MGLHALFDLCLSIEKSDQPVTEYGEVESKLKELVAQSVAALSEVIKKAD